MNYRSIPAGLALIAALATGCERQPPYEPQEMTGKVTGVYTPGMNPIENVEDAKRLDYLVVGIKPTTTNGLTCAVFSKETRGPEKIIVEMKKLRGQEVLFRSDGTVTIGASPHDPKSGRVCIDMGEYSIYGATGRQ